MSWGPGMDVVQSGMFNINVMATQEEKHSLFTEKQRLHKEAMGLGEVVFP